MILFSYIPYFFPVFRPLCFRFFFFLFYLRATLFTSYHNTFFVHLFVYYPGHEEHLDAIHT